MISKSGRHNNASTKANSVAKDWNRYSTITLHKLMHSLVITGY